MYVLVALPPPALPTDAEAGARGVESGSWDSIHVVEVEPEGGSKFSYHLVSTFILQLSARAGQVDLSGNITSQVEMIGDIDHSIGCVC